MNWKWHLLYLVVAPLSFAMHEGAHWLAGTLLGYEMEAGINHVRLISGEYTSVLHENIVSGAGPAVTAAQAVIAYLFVVARQSRLAFVFLFTALAMRLLAFGVSFANLNDEARISLSLGWPWQLLPAIVVTALLAMTLIASYRLRLGWRSWAASYVAISIAIAAIVFGEAFLPTLS